MAASNTRECFSEFVGLRVVGVMFNTLPVADRHIASGTKTLIFEDGRGLTITSTGTFWVNDAQEVGRAVQRKRKELAATQSELAGILALAGHR